MGPGPMLRPFSHSGNAEQPLAEICVKPNSGSKARLPQVFFNFSFEVILMSLREKLPLLRRISQYAIPVACAVMIAAIQPAFAQTTSNSDFASSTQGIVTDFDAGLPGSPSLAAGAGGQSGSYGYHEHNWSSHLTFEGGGGFNAPLGNDHPFITYGGNFTGGVGYRFMKRLSVMTEYQFIDDKLPGSLIADVGAQGGHAHIWSLTMDPVIDLFPDKKNDVYITGGGGFYRKVTSFTDPEEVEECSFFCFTGTEEVVVSHFSSNQGGLNLGLGITHTLGSADTGSDGRLKVFAEARYLWLNTPGIGANDGLGTTELIPVTIGLRW